MKQVKKDRIAGGPRCQEGYWQAVRHVSSGEVYLYDSFMGTAYCWSDKEGWTTVAEEGPKVGRRFSIELCDDSMYIAGGDGLSAGLHRTTLRQHGAQWEQITLNIDLVCVYCKLQCVSKDIVICHGPGRALHIAVSTDGAVTEHHDNLYAGLSCEGFSLVVFEGSLVTFGGICDRTPSNSVHILQKSHWFVQYCGGDVPPARAWHACDVVGAHMIIMGGKGASDTVLPTAYTLHLVSLTWRQLQLPTVLAIPRCGHFISFIKRPFGVFLYSTSEAIFVHSISNDKSRNSSRRPSTIQHYGFKMKPSKPVKPNTWSIGVGPSGRTFSTYRADAALPSAKIDEGDLHHLMTRLNKEPRRKTSRTEEEYLKLINGKRPEPMTQEDEREHIDRVFYQYLELKALKTTALAQKWNSPQESKKLSPYKVHDLLDHLVPPKSTHRPRPPRTVPKLSPSDTHLVNRLHDTDVFKRRKFQENLVDNCYYHW